MSPHTRKSALNGMLYPLTLILLLAVAPARGDDGVRTPHGETGAAPAIAAEVSEKIDQEIVLAEAGIKADPSASPAHVRLGYLLIKKGALDQAMKSFDEAIRLNPRSYDAKTGRGIVLSRTGNLKDAELVLKEALILNPNPVRTHYELGLLYQKLNEFEKAVAEFKEGINKHEQGRM